MGLFARLIAAASVLVLFMVGSVGWFSYRIIESSTRPRELASMRALADSWSREFELRANGWAANLALLRKNPAVAGLVRARLAGGRDPVDGIPFELWAERLSESFRGALDTDPAILQLRLIGEADLGREIVRVDRPSAGGPVRRTAETELQRKGERGYFVAAQGLAEGQLYVSPIELNREFGQVAEPHIPVLRIATPVFSAKGARFGALVINIDMTALLDSLRASAWADEQVFLARAPRDYVVHPDRELEFSRDLGLPAPTQTELDVWLASWSGREGRFTSMVDDMSVSVRRIQLAGGPTLTLVRRQSLASLGASSEIRNTALWIALAAGTLAWLGSLIIARGVTLPVARLTRSIERYPDELPENLPVDSPGEIGRLALTFKEMAHAVRAQTRQLEQAAQRDRLHVAVFNSSDDAIIASDLEGRITAWNPASEELYGYAIDDALGYELSLIEIGAGGPTLEQLHQAVRDRELVPPRDLELRHRDGHVVEVLASASPIVDDRGEVTGVAFTTRDLSTLRRSERQLRQLVEASPHGTAVIDRSGQISLTNRAMQSIFGYTGAEFANLNIDQLLPEDMRTHHTELRADYMRNPEIRPMGSGRDLFALRKDGEQIPVEVALSPFENLDGDTQIVASVVDITRRTKLAEASLAKRVAQLEQSNQDLREFATVASHDLKAPVRGIALLATWILEDLEGELQPETRENLRLLRSRVQRLQKLIEGILIYSSVDRAESRPREINTWALVTGVLDALEIPAAFDIRIEGSWPWVYWDETQLEQVFQNLIQNALVHHGKPLGEIVLRCERAEDAVWFHVIDDGVGIPESHRERIFNLFETLRPKDSTDSTGIGLATVKRMVGRNQGTIRVTDGSKGGVDVAFSVPHARVRWIQATTS